MKEIGSNAKYCLSASNGASTYQAACCTTATKNMKLYDQCAWAAWPLCDQDTSCPESQAVVAASGSGSGDSRCSGFPSPLSKRKYCCDNADEHSQSADCAWHRNLNPGSALHEAYFGHANCPTGTVRVAMDHADCSGWSAQARCCTPNIKAISDRGSSVDAEFEFYLGKFMEQFAAT
jgi:hypothetical protein